MSEGDLTELRCPNCKRMLMRVSQVQFDEMDMMEVEIVCSRCGKKVLFKGFLAGLPIFIDSDTNRRIESASGPPYLI